MGMPGWREDLVVGVWRGVRGCGSGGKVPVERGSGDVELLGDFADGELAVAQHRFGGFQLGGVQLGGAAEGLAGGPGGFEAGAGCVPG